MVDIDSDTNEVCYQITHSGIDDPAAAHIHQAASDANGGVVVDFDVATNGLAGCVTGDAAIVTEILANPGIFYVNVHNEAFPAGAIRGQLASGTLPATGTNLTLVLLIAGIAFIAAGGVFYTATARLRG